MTEKRLGDKVEFTITDYNGTNYQLSLGDHKIIVPKHIVENTTNPTQKIEYGLGQFEPGDEIRLVSFTDPETAEIYKENYKIIPGHTFVVRMLDNMKVICYGDSYLPLIPGKCHFVKK